MSGGPDAVVGALNLHAVALVVGEAGLLIRGGSGAGKTRLALALVDAARRDGTFASLVADDRALVSRHGDRLVARPHPALAGLAERRGFGILPVAHEPACALVLVVDLVAGWPERLPQPDARRCEISRVVLPRLAVAAEASTPDAVVLILSVLAASCGQA
ncbi:HPr kinase/phosphorylase [Lichenibacterium ramalinae]|uniref:HPr kinase/phosphorylase n=1 Tax=Lichenibacterium ramalinae TaxID=2316527 RepID=UPI001FE1EF55|nr:aldolase [Lichenibacterium ramalinae]